MKFSNVMADVFFRRDTEHFQRPPTDEGTPWHSGIPLLAARNIKLAIRKGSQLISAQLLQPVRLGAKVEE